MALARSLPVDVAVPRSDLDVLDFVAVVTKVLREGVGGFGVIASHFGASDGDACRCRFPLEEVVMDPLPIPEFRLKTIICRTWQRRRFAPLPSCGRCRGAQAPSIGSWWCAQIILCACSATSSCRFCAFVHLFAVRCLLFDFLDLLCLRAFSLHCIVRPCTVVIVLYIKRAKT